MCLEPTGTCDDALPPASVTSAGKPSAGSTGTVRSAGTAEWATTTLEPVAVKAPSTRVDGVGLLKY